MTEPVQPAQPQEQPQGEPLPVPSKEACTMAMLAHLLAIFTGFIGPLVIYLIKKDDDRFIAFHSLQALYWMLGIFILSIPTCGLAAIVGIVYSIITLIKANKGEWAEYPVVGAWAKK